jgi:hypothetical protein
MMTMRAIFLFLAVATTASAFTIHPSRATMLPKSYQLAMASDDISPLPLESSATDEDAPPTTDEDAPKAIYRNLGKGGELTETKWVDPAMQANTNIFDASWWAYLLFGFPMVLLLNDFLHFLPTDGPLAFLTSI